MHCCVVSVVVCSNCDLVDISDSAGGLGHINTPYVKYYPWSTNRLNDCYMEACNKGKTNKNNVKKKLLQILRID